MNPSCIAWNAKQDDGETARLALALGRPSSEWVWYRAGSTVSAPPRAMMKLDAGNRLHLMTPEDPSQTAILLDPAEGAASSIRGVLRVRPGGDISMGEFTSGPQP